MPAHALLKTYDVLDKTPERIPLKTTATKEVKRDRPGWIPSHLTENWETDPFAYQTEEDLMPAGGLHGQLLTYMTEVMRTPLEKQGLMLLVDTFLLYRDQKHIKMRVAPDLLLMPYHFPAPSAYDLDVRPPPRCVLETTSPKSHFKDLKANVSFYFNLGVETYLVIDAITPFKTLRDPFELHLWRKGQPYQKMAADSAGYFLLPEMNIQIKAQRKSLIFMDAVTGQVLRDTGQLGQALEEAEQRAQVAFENGIEQGVQNKAIEIAHNLLVKGIDLAIVAETTGLSPDDLASLGG